MNFGLEWLEVDRSITMDEVKNSAREAIHRKYGRLVA